MAHKVRIVIKEVQALMPHGEPLTVWHTIEIESSELAELLGTTNATVVGAEAITPQAKESEGAAE